MKQKNTKKYNFYVIKLFLQEKSKRVAGILERSGVRYTHLNSVTPQEKMHKRWIGRGVWNRYAVV